jgi:hypothetical protein
MKWFSESKHSSLLFDNLIDEITQDVVDLEVNNFFYNSKFSGFVSKAFLMMALLIFALPVLVSAQSVSGVTGVVSDESGAVVPGVDVTLTDTKTSKEINTKTNDQGVYTFQNIQPGQGYKLTFKVQGFQTYSISEVVLGVARTETYNAALTTGQVSETVDVTTSSGETLNTTDATLGNIIDTRQLRELPIQIRNSPAALIGLQPGVVGNNVGTGSTNRVGSVTGSRADQGNITVDGIDANDQATGQAFSTVGNAPIDAIQEFRAVTTNPSAAEGRSSGGQVQLVTKSGTNEFHGSLREYNRTAATAANSFFNNKNGIERPQLTRNQFGGNLGGPLPFFNFGDGGPFFRSGKDRLFFFFDYEGRRDAQGVSYARIVPLDNFRNGGLAYINNTAGCTASSRLNTTPQCITVLTPAQVAALDPRGVGANQALLSFVNSRYPAANDLTLGDGVNTGGFRFNAPSKRTDNTYTTRFDFNATDTQKVFVRFNIARRLQTDTVNSVAQQFPGDPESAQISQKDYSVVAGHSWVISNSLFNQFTIGNSHSGLDFLAPFRPAFPNIFTLGVLTAPFADISLQSRIIDTPTIRDDATYTIGSHNFFFGSQLKPIRSQSGLVNDFNNVTVGLGGNTTTLNASLRPANIRTGTTSAAVFDRSFALLLGRLGSIGTTYNYDTNGQAFAPGTGKMRDFRYNEYEYYVQDNWRIRNNLTLNFGLRYQYYQPPYEANGFQAGNDVNLDELFAIRQRNAAAGIAGDSAEPFLSYTLIGKGNDSRPYYKPDKNNFAPRFGFAYTPNFKNGFLNKVFGDDKTVIRGGFSQVYERVGGSLTFIQDQVSYLFDNSATTNFGSADARTALLNDPRFTGIGSVPVQNTAPVITNPFIPFVSNGVPFGNAEGQTNYSIDQNFQVPYSYQYSFGFQRELFKDFLVEVSYVGRKGRKLFTQADAAQVIDFKDNASGQFLFQALNGLQTQLINNSAITNQPFLENQINQAAINNYGGTCVQVFQSSCTQLVGEFFGSLVQIGDTADTIQALFANGLLNSNVGLSGQFSTNAYITNLGKSDYNGLLISVQKRFAKGFQFDFNYTLSDSKDNNSSVANTVFGGLICDLKDTEICRGPSDFDIRHLINVNGIFEVPVGRGKSIGGNMPGWLNAIVGGFQLSGIYTYRSGLPFSTTTGSFPVGFVLDSPAVLSGNRTPLSGAINNVGSTIQFFGDQSAALAAFRNPTNGEIGQRNVLRGPSFWNVDLGIAKNFKLPWENQRLQIRADAFNAFNRNVFGLPNANINGGIFGQITTSATAPRELQFAIRYDF